MNTIKSKFPLTKARDIEEHTKEAKRLMQKGGDDFMKKFEEFQKKQLETPDEEPVIKDEEQLSQLEASQRAKDKRVYEETQAKIAKAKKDKQDREDAIAAETAKKAGYVEKERKMEEELAAKKKQIEEMSKLAAE